MFLILFCYSCIKSSDLFRSRTYFEINDFSDILHGSLEGTSAHRSVSTYTRPKREKTTDIHHALNGIQTHDYSVQQVQDLTILQPFDHCDWTFLFLIPPTLVLWHFLSAWKGRGIHFWDEGPWGETWPVTGESVLVWTKSHCGAQKFRTFAAMTSLEVKEAQGKRKNPHWPDRP
jgi:hypothetical protein